ncbi:hypothetical protein M9434_001805 [Picochlorum sp. BPE23]|nr:hypothetical protein M9434_001805 [Picochlorum sp. BPE23]
MFEIRYSCSILWVLLLLLSTYLYKVLGEPVHKITTSGPSCSVPSPPATLNDIECGPNTTATLEDARALAWKFAPVLKFHPLEPYHLQDMNVWYNASTIFLTDFKPYPNSTYNYVVANTTNKELLGPKTFASILNSTKLTQEERDAILAGAPFDANGKSTGKIFYTVTDYSDSLWLYNFNLFYSWNGCSNQAVALSFNGTEDVQQYLMCPTGVHEGDLERMSMLVCKSDQKIKQIAYSQHAWTEVRDCQQDGQCLFDQTTGNPISYVALEGHGNYPENSEFHVYYYQGSSIQGQGGFDNIGGIYIGDRTGDDVNKTFIPTQNNIVYIPPSWAILEGDDGVVYDEWEWAVYPGNWGAPLRSAPLTIFCFNENATQYITCPNNSTTIQAIKTIADVLGLSKTIDGQEGIGSFAIQTFSNDSTVGCPDITGPLFRAFTYQYIASKSAPILSENVTELVCPKDQVSLETIPQRAQLNASVNTLISYLVGITIGTFIFSIILIILLALPLILDKTSGLQQFVSAQASKFRMSSGESKITIVQDSTPDDLSKNGTSASKIHANQLASRSTASSSSSLYITVNPVLSQGQLKRLIVWGFFAMALFIAGIVVISIGLSAMFNNSVLTVAADKLQQNSLVTTLNWLTTGVLVFVLVCDVVMFSLIFLFNDKKIEFGRIRFHNPLGGITWIMSKGYSILSFMIGIIALIIALSAVLFSLGLLISIIQLATRIACNSIFTISVVGQSLSTVCIEIQTINLKICGWEALETCGNVTTMTVRLIMVGAMLFLWCHLVWMIILLDSLETFRSHQIRLSKWKKDASAGVDCEESVDDRLPDQSNIDSLPTQDNAIEP